MRTQSDIWTLASDVMAAYGPYYQPDMVALIRASDALEFWYPLTLARGAAPDPFALETFQALVPYTNPARLQAILDAAADAGFLAKSGSDYQLTAVANRLLDEAYAIAHAGIQQAPALSDAAMQRLSSAFGQIVNATISAAEPADKRSLLYSRWTDAGAAAAAAVKLDQFITDLLRYRDDAHLAAWQATGVNGPTWETLTFLWRGDADTPAALADQLAHRHYTAQAYASSIQTLEQKGWIVDAGGPYKLTAAGTAVREAAETETNRLFFVGWSVLDEAEQQAVGDLLADLKTAVEAAAPVREPAAA